MILDTSFQMLIKVNNCLDFENDLLKSLIYIHCLAKSIRTIIISIPTFKLLAA